MTPSYRVTPINAFTDNYIWAITCPDLSGCVVVDPGDGDKVMAFLARHNLTLLAIFLTHHHNDHIGGVELLTSQYQGVPVYGPTREACEWVTHPVAQDHSIKINELALEFNILETPGHTLGHIVYCDDYSLFCGDTLFSAGCGRMFEGTPAMFAQSLTKLAELPDTIKVYCAHEYTLANLAFAQSVWPHSTEITQYINHCQTLRSQGEPTLPSSMAVERTINPFLNLNATSLVKALNTQFNLSLTTDQAANFKWLRHWKDVF